MKAAPLSPTKLTSSQRENGFSLRKVLNFASKPLSLPQQPMSNLQGDVDDALNFHHEQNELDNLKQQNQDLKQTLSINKKLLSSLMSVDNKNDVQQSICDLEVIISSMQSENTQLKSILQVKDTELAQLKQNLNVMDSNIDYKLSVWAQFEQELSQSLKKESALYKQIQVTTQSLRLGEKNNGSSQLIQLVKENQKLFSDQEQALSIGKRISSQLTALIEKFENKQSPLKKDKGRQSIFDKFKSTPSIGIELSNLLESVDLNMQLLTIKVGEFNEENTLLRDESARCNANYINLNKRVVYYQEKIKLYQESQGVNSSSCNNDSQYQSPSKAGTGFSIRLLPTTPNARETPRDSTLSEIQMKFNQNVEVSTVTAQKQTILTKAPQQNIQQSQQENLSVQQLRV